MNHTILVNDVIVQLTISICINKSNGVLSGLTATKSSVMRTYQFSLNIRTIGLRQIDTIIVLSFHKLFISQSHAYLY